MKTGELIMERKEFNIDTRAFAIKLQRITIETREFMIKTIGSPLETGKISNTMRIYNGKRRNNH